MSKIRHSVATNLPIDDVHSPGTSFDVLLDKPVGIAAIRVVCQWSSEQATRNGRPRDRANAKVLTKRSVTNVTNSDEQPAYLERRVHLTLLFTVNEIIVILHRYKGCEVVVDSVVCHTDPDEYDAVHMARRLGTYSA